MQASLDPPLVRIYIVEAKKKTINTMAVSPLTFLPTLGGRPGDREEVVSGPDPPCSTGCMFLIHPVLQSGPETIGIREEAGWH